MTQARLTQLPELVTGELQLATVLEELKVLPWEMFAAEVLSANHRPFST